MDRYNMKDLHEMAPKDATAKVELLGMYEDDGKPPTIQDPYFVSRILMMKN